MQVARGRKVITAFHLLHQRFTYRSTSSWFNRIREIEREVIRDSALLVANSSATRRDLIDFGADPKRIFVISNGVSQDYFTVTRVPAGATLRILFAGRLVEQKGADLLPSVVRRLAETDVNWTMRIVGAGPCIGAITEAILALPGAPVEYVGVATQRQMPAEYARSDVTLSLTRYEPFGLFALESIATGTPVLGRIVDGMRDFCLAGENCLETDEGQTLVGGVVAGIRALAAGTARLPDAHSIRESVGRFTWDAAAARLNELYAVA